MHVKLPTLPVSAQVYLHSTHGDLRRAGFRCHFSASSS